MGSEIVVIEKNEDVEILHLETAPYGTNAYMLICRETAESILIDAPGDAGLIREELLSSDVRYILLTHGHMDHTMALEELETRLSATVAAHRADTDRLPVKPGRLLEEGDSVQFGLLSLDVMHTPGHTPGSLCFLFGSFLFSGDTLFPGGPGKTASPSNFEQIMDSIEKKILTLPDETIILPGHGTKTDLGTERKSIDSFRSRHDSYNFSGDVTWQL